MGLSEIPTGAKERYAYLWKDTQISYVKVDGTIMESRPDPFHLGLNPLGSIREKAAKRSRPAV